MGHPLQPPSSWRPSPLSTCWKKSFLSRVSVPVVSMSNAVFASSQRVCQRLLVELAGEVGGGGTGFRDLSPRPSVAFGPSVLKVFPLSVPPAFLPPEPWDPLGCTPGAQVLVPRVQLAEKKVKIPRRVAVGGDLGTSHAENAGSTANASAREQGPSGTPAALLPGPRRLHVEGAGGLEGPRPRRTVVTVRGNQARLVRVGDGTRKEQA